MNSLEVISAFKRYMKEKGIWGNFVLYFKDETKTRELEKNKPIPSRKVGSISLFLMERHPKNFIQEAFQWVATPEGFKFWSDISKDWKTMCQNPRTEIGKLTIKEYGYESNMWEDDRPWLA